MLQILAQWPPRRSNPLPAIRGAFSTKESSIATNRSSSFVQHHRSRSLSRFSRSFTFCYNDESNTNNNELSARRGRFVNTMKGYGLPEISLNDLTIEFFEFANRNCSGSGRFDSRATPGCDAGRTTSQRRRRSISRKGSGASDDQRSSISRGEDRFPM